MLNSNLLIEQAAKLLIENPNSTTAHTQLGNAYLHAKKRGEARDHFQKAISLDSKNIHAYLGLSQTAQDRYKSINFLEKAIAIDPNNAEVYLLMGRTYRKFKNNHKAVEYLKKALDINNSNVDGWIDLGICYFYQDDLNKAIECMQKAIDLDPKAYKGYTNLSHYYFNAGKYSDAIDYGKKAVELDPQHSAGYFNLGFPHFALGNYELAIDSFKKALSIDPQHVQAQYQLGNLYIAIGEYENAQAAFEKAIDIDYRYEPAHIGLGNVFIDVGLPEKAIKEFRHKLFSNISPHLSNDLYAFEVGKINLANRKYLHINSLQNMAGYFERIPLAESKEYASILMALYKVLVEKLPPVISQIKDNKTLTVIMHMYELVSNRNEELSAKRKRFADIKEELKDPHFNNAVLRLIVNTWLAIEQYLEGIVPIFPRLSITAIKAENMIFQESGTIRFAILNSGLSQANNVIIKVQPSNEFAPIQDEIKIPSIYDSTEFDLKMAILTHGQFSVTVQCSFIGGQDVIQTFRFNAFRKNPFFYGRPVKDPDMFFGREQLLEKILERIKNVAKQDILVHGIRRIGKTSLLYQIKNRLQLPQIPVYFSLQQIGEVDDISILRQLLFEICDTLGKTDTIFLQHQQDGNIPSYITNLKAPLSFDNISRAFRKDLEAILGIIKDIAPGIRIVILLDEADLLFRIGVHMQRFVRDLLQRYDQIVMIMAGSPKIIELSADTYDSPFYNNFAHENLIGLEFQEAKGLIQTPMEAIGITCSLDIAKGIFDFCGGISYYIQAVCFHLLDETYRKRKSECTSEELQISNEKVFSELRRSFEAIWQEFNKEQQYLLEYLSKCEDAIHRADPSLKEMNSQILNLSEYSIILISDDKISIKAELIKRWIREICKYD